MMPDDADAESMRADIAEMEHMLDDYLAFARGEGGEDASITDISELVREAAAAAERARPQVQISVTAPPSCPGQGPSRRIAAGAGQPDRQCPQAWLQGGRAADP